MLSQRPKTRLAVMALAAVACLVAGLFVAHQVFLPILAYFIPSLEKPFYDLAVYGAYPAEEFVSFDLPSSHPNLVKWDDQCDSGNVFVTLNGASIEHPGPSVLDARGGLVWTTDEYGTVLNMRLQWYKGEKYITFWAGTKSGTMGQGSYYMLDSSYNVFKKLDAVGENYHGDLHEFKITDDDTALLTVYTAKQVDLTDLGHWRGKNGWIVDSMFQEIDIETEKLMFEWSASDHFPPSESYMTNPLGGYSESSPFDSFHINSVDKEPSSGNYMISSRHTHHLPDRRQIRRNPLATRRRAQRLQGPQRRPRNRLQLATRRALDRPTFRPERREGHLHHLLLRQRHGRSLTRRRHAQQRAHRAS